MAREFTVGAAVAIDMGANVVGNVADPLADQDAATKKYVDDNAGGSGVPDPSGEPDGKWLRTASGAAIWDDTVAADIPITDAGGYYTGTDVEAALQELGAAGPGGGGGITVIDYVGTTSDLTITATTAAGAQTWITGNSHSYDGSTRILIEFFAFFGNATTSAEIIVNLWDSASGGTDLGRFGQFDYTGSYYAGAVLTPSNASHTYTLKAWRTGSNRQIGSSASFASGFGSHYRIVTL